jgi:hypothetical protein
LATFADPAPRGWSYQTFGWWYDQSGIYDVLGDLFPMGAFSVGAVTPGAAIPITGSAVFAGKLAGMTDKPFGQQIAAPMTLSVNFAGRSASFASPDWWQNAAVVPGTALSGTLTYSAQQNLLAGTLTTANGQMTGPVTAQFYGPAAEEVGGTIFLTNGQAQPTRVVAGFGAAR